MFRTSGLDLRRRHLIGGIRGGKIPVRSHGKAGELRKVDNITARTEVTAFSSHGNGQVIGGIGGHDKRIATANPEV